MCIHTLKTLLNTLNCLCPQLTEYHQPHPVCIYTTTYIVPNISSSSSTLINLLLLDFARSCRNAEYPSSPSITPTLPGQMSSAHDVYFSATIVATTNLVTIEYSSLPSSLLSISPTPQKYLKEMQTYTQLISGTTSIVLNYYGI